MQKYAYLFFQFLYYEQDDNEKQKGIWKQSL